MEFWTAPRLWENETAVIAATGPSVTPEQVNYCRGKARVLCINTSYQLALWADALYFADLRWFDHNYEGLKDFKGLKVTIENTAQALEKDPTLKVMRNDDHTAKQVSGLCLEPDGLRTGRNSGCQAINLCYHLGVKRIVLIGFDMQAKPGKRYWFGNDYGWSNSGPQVYQNSFLPRFKAMVEPLKQAGVEVLNATPDSAMECWPMVSLEEALRDPVCV